MSRSSRFLPEQETNKRFMKLKAVLFDMDDTLIDWGKRAIDWEEHERRHLANVFDYIVAEVHPLQEREAFYRQVREHSRQGWLEAEAALRAPSYADALRRALLEVGVPAGRIDTDRCMSLYGWGLLDGIAAFPEAAEVLALLRDHGLQIGLVTNASVSMRYRDSELEQVNLLQFFADCRIAAVDVGYIKPHRAIFEAALERLGVHPGEAVFVGDNPVADIHGAQQVGMKAVLRLLDHRETVIPPEIQPDGQIRTLHELLPLLDNWYPDWRANTDGRVNAQNGQNEQNSGREELAQS